LKKILKGIIVGISCLLPGVCSGLVAITLNVYNDLLEIGSGYYKIKVLIKNVLLLMGMLIGIILTILILTSLNENYPFLVNASFIGFATSSLFIYASTFKDDIHASKLRRTVLIIIGCIVIIAFDYLSTLILVVNFSNSNIIIFIIGGLLSSFAFIAPGISGSLILVVLGIYFPLFSFIKRFLTFDFNFLFNDYIIIISFFIAFMLGIIISSKLLQYLVKNKYYYFYNISLGMIVGSIIVLFKSTIKLFVLSQLLGYIIILLISFFLFYNIAKEKYGM